MNRQTGSTSTAMLLLIALNLTACAAPTSISAIPGTETPGLSTAVVETIVTGGDQTSDPHIIEVSLQDGKTLTIGNPSTHILLHRQFYDLRTNVSLIDSIVQQAPGYLVTFNDGATLQVESLAGSVSYHGDFGEEQLSFESIRGLRTLKNVYKEAVDQSFSRDFYGIPIDLSFTDGTKQRIYTIDSQLRLNSSYEGYEAAVYISRAPMNYDWQARMVEVKDPVMGTLELSIKDLPVNSPETTIYTDHGTLDFNWAGLLSSQPVGEKTGTFQPLFSLAWANGTKMPVNLSYYFCPAENYSCEALDGVKNTMPNWSQVQSITPLAETGSARLTFIAGSDQTLQAFGLVLGWSLGEINLPLSSQVFTSITRAGQNPPSSAGQFNLSIRLANGDEIKANVTGTNGNDTTAPDPRYDVLHLVGFPVAMGTWLVDWNWLEVDNTGNQLSVLVFGQPYPSPDSANLDLDLINDFGNLSLSMSKIDSIRPVSPDSPTAVDQVQLTTRDGQVHTFPLEKLQFIRYPDRINNGTTYFVKLGAWFWRRYDTVKVKTDTSTVDVDLSQVTRLRLSGNYPDWEIEIESRGSSGTLHGQVVPAEVISNGPGVGSWRADREGFWFSWHAGHTFLFVPAKDISEIRIGK